MTEKKEFRYEKKTIISEMKFYDVENIVKINPCMFFEEYPERYVNNIYFDSINMKNYDDSIAGNSNRFKVRIRWYGPLFGFIENPILEFKVKKSDLITKFSFQLKSFKLDENFSLFYLQKEVFAKSNLPRWTVEKFKLIKPTLLNRYTRKYFKSRNRKHRITLDRDLGFYRMGDVGNRFSDSYLDRNNIILEIKYGKADDDLSVITNYFPFRFSANSKYVFGIDLINF